MTVTAAALSLTACSGGAAGPSGPQFGPQQSAAYAPQTVGAQAFQVPADAPLITFVPAALTGRVTPNNLTKPIIDDTGSFPSGPIIIGTNTAKGTGVEGEASASGGEGIAGVASSTDTDGVAVYGLASGTGSYGVYGYSGKGVGVRGFTANSASFAGYFSNTNGTAVDGVSSTGSAILGSTAFASGNGGNFAQAGILGKDLSTDNGEGDAGVAGITVTGYGVYGQAGGNGQGAGVAGVGNNRSVGVSGSVPFGAAGGVGVGAGNNSSATGLFGNGDGLSAFSRNATAIVAEAEAASTTQPVLLLFTDDHQPYIIGEDGNGAGPAFSIDAKGNMILGGSLTVDGTIQTTSYLTCSSCPGPLAKHRGPPVEDTGEAQLTAGHGYVQLDSDFAAKLDPAQRYHVFITPEGENNGLYVTGKTNTGFSVREVHNGRSNIAFDYRVVGAAKSTGHLATPIQTRSSPPKWVKGRLVLR